MSGHATLGTNALIGLHMEGGAASPTRLSTRPGAPNGLHAVSLRHLNIADVDLKVMGTKVTTGGIEIRGLDHCDIQLKGRTPVSLRASVDQIVVHGFDAHQVSP